ncbi:hypothetical protein I6N95_25735 [Vagococcus sp. BWB3-3]|uniref:Uncharacterized protein n=1 Tax=Vagococcus allomyrinae TaxID=2794353 RepID=A0A940SXS0_9ENTE|nr:hypothetical protein [Vagococcus allomyrinae]MBP1044414.1 hypothetical protein [Vagococcus allomyrinae]
MYKGFANYSSDETGYIWVEVPELLNENDVDFRPKLVDVYQLYNQGELNQKLFKALVDETATSLDKEKEDFGYSMLKSKLPVYANELTFKHVVNPETKKMFQKIEIKGKDAFFDEESLNYRSNYFEVSEDGMSIQINSDGYPDLFLVGFKGHRGVLAGIPKYFVKFSDEKETFEFDPLYTNDEIEVE